MAAAMVLRGMSVLCLLILGLSVSSSYSHCKAPAGETAYQQFKRQHHDNPKTSGGNDYCNKMMHRKCMTNRDPPHTRCKEKNSFIHTTINMIGDVCGKAGSPYDNNLRVSNQPFSITTCKCQGNPQVHPCEYRGSTATRRIVIDCENGLPVHFAEGIVVPN